MLRNRSFVFSSCLLSSVSVSIESHSRSQGDLPLDVQQGGVARLSLSLKSVSWWSFCFGSVGTIHVRRKANSNTCKQSIVGKVCKNAALDIMFKLQREIKLSYQTETSCLCTQSCLAPRSLRSQAGAGFSVCKVKNTESFLCLSDTNSIEMVPA